MEEREQRFVLLIIDERGAEYGIVVHRLRASNRIDAIIETDRLIYPDGHILSESDIKMIIFLLSDSIQK